jgi:hypothetical protein
MEINLATRIQPKGKAMFIDHHRPDNILSSPQSVQDIMPCVAVNSTVGQPPRASLRAQSAKLPFPYITSFSVTRPQATLGSSAARGQSRLRGSPTPFSRAPV